jgi:hypothetical protein
MIRYSIESLEFFGRKMKNLLWNPQTPYPKDYTYPGLLMYKINCGYLVIQVTPL